MNDSWVLLGSDGNAPSAPPQAAVQPERVVDEEESMLRLVTSVSECMSILGQESGFKLGEVSAACRYVHYWREAKTRGRFSHFLSLIHRKFHCDSGLAVEYLLSQVARAPRPSAPQLEVPPPIDRPLNKTQTRCQFCEVLNPPANLKCFVCDTPIEPSVVLPVHVSGDGKGNNNFNFDEKGKEEEIGRIESYRDVEIPAEMLDGDVDLTKSVEIAIKQMLFAEFQEKEKARLREEELTTKYLREESKRKQKELDAKSYECAICFADCKIEEM